MKPVWIAVFASLALSTSLSHPQQTSSIAIPAKLTSSNAKTASQAPLAHAMPSVPEVTEDELRQRLVGKQLFLRGLWLDEDLHFNMYGDLPNGSPKGSFTLCAVEIEKVHMDKRRVELEGVRYGIHFAGEASWSSQATSFDRIRITPKKKHLEIVIDRQLVVVPKKKKGEEEKAAANAKKGTAASAGSAEPAAPSATDATEVAKADDATSGATGEAKGAVAEGETTTNPAESAGHLRDALEKIFASSLDDRMIAKMPDYWQYFYHAQLDHQSIEPTDPNIVRPGPGVQGPMLVKNVPPDSNDYAQKSEVAGVASYKVILGADGKPMAIAVYRPIGFGLDENAVSAIKKSTFVAAVKDGKPVPSVIDVAVNFRIYSKRTSQSAPTETADAAAGAPVTPAKAPLPGPYTANAARQ